MKRVQSLVALAVGVFYAGCGFSQTTPLEEAPALRSCGKNLYVGAIYDLRLPTLPAGAGVNPGADDEPGEAAARVTDEATDLILQREIRIPVSEARSVVAAELSRSGLFERVVNPPSAFAGQRPDELIVRAQDSCDLLLVGEINRFHLKNLGYNDRSTFSIPLDLLLAPLSFATYLTTGGNAWLFTGALMPAWSCEVVLSASVTLIDLSTGQVAHTVRLEERVSSPYDMAEAFATLWDGSDDWIDLGRRLGEVALHNAAVRLVEQLGETFPPDEPGGDE